MKNYIYALSALAMMGVMASCNSEESSADQSSATPKQAVVNITLGTRSTTRAVGALPSDNGADISANEGKVNSYVISLFDTDGNLLNEYEKDAYAASTPITTTTKARKILVAANPNVATPFASAASITSFRDITSDLSYTTSTDGKANTAKNTVNSQKMTGLPMFVEADDKLTAFETVGTTSADVSLELSRLVARVALVKLDVSQLPSGASFTPQEIFMYNVNDKCTLGGTPSQSAGLKESSIATDAGKCEMTDANGALIATLTDYAYLSSGLLSLTKDANNQYVSATNPYFFYVFPHESANPTKLVVKGLYKSSASATGTVCYYPIIVNHGQVGTTIVHGSVTTTGEAVTDDSQIKANSTYGISLSIKGEGSASPLIDSNSATANITMTVAAWSGYTQEVVVGK